jgi:hypothetical protein
MNIFNNLKVYAGKYQVTATRKFDQEEIDAILSAVVVSSKYGYSVQFTMAKGGLTFIPLDRDSSLGEGEVVDVRTANILTLSKQGEPDIFRVLE